MKPIAPKPNPFIAEPGRAEAFLNLSKASALPGSAIKVVLIPLAILLSTVLLSASIAGAQTREDQLGLRCARRLDDHTIRLTFGSSFVPAIGEQAAAYRIVSATDEAFKEGVRADKAEHTSAPDVQPPDGYHGKTFDRHTVTLHIPTAMKAGQRYFVQALGIHPQPITGGKAAAWIEAMDDATEKKLAGENALGIRSVEIISPNTICITTGDGLDAARLDGHPELVTLVSLHGIPPLVAKSVGRRTRGECFYTDGWPYGVYLKHEIFATFDQPLLPIYAVHIDDSAIIADSAAGLVVNDDTAINPAVKVNQIGYLLDAAKFAYVGEWMGSAGALPASAWPNHFEVRDAKTHQPVLKGDCTLRHHAGDDTEGQFKKDYSGEDVLQLDLSPLKAPGEYYVVLPGSGRSFTFRVADDIYTDAFKVMMTGVAHQRCGIEINAPWSDYFHPACHRDCTLLADLPHGSEGDAFNNFPKHVIDTRKLDFPGGHHDAGDFNPRSHIEIAEMAFFLYEIHPTAFTDGQLRIPESANGIPDLLDEGRWALDLWVHLQDTDGGVRDGIESDGDPDQITVPEEDPRVDYTFAKSAKGSLRFAACCAQASILWDHLGKHEDAAAFLKHARDAWAWAAAHGGEAEHDMTALAGIQLYRATDEPAFRAAFETHSVFARMEKPSLAQWQKFDQYDASFYYARCDRAVDAKLKDKILSAYRDQMQQWIGSCKTLAYPLLKDPYAPNTWGTAAHPKFLIPAIQADVLLNDPEIHKWIILSCDYALGCNPMNTVFTTRLGQRNINSPLHLFSRYQPDAPIPGLQCQGPSPRKGGDAPDKRMGSWIAPTLFPIGDWPELQTYCDLGMVPEMNEGVVVDQMKTAVAYGYLVPEHKRD